MPARSDFRLTAFVLFLVALLIIAALGVSIANFLKLIAILPHVEVRTDAPESTSADDVTAIFSATGLLVAICAAWVAYRTLTAQQHENRAQRQMETLRAMNARYDDVIDSAFRLRLNTEPVATATTSADFNSADLGRLYNQYFATLMMQFRYRRLDLIPEEDVVDWTILLINRFRLRKRCLSGVPAADGDGMRQRWAHFDSFVPGRREHFVKYIAGIIEAADDLGDIDADTPADKADAQRVEKMAKKIVADIDMSERRS